MKRFKIAATAFAGVLACCASAFAVTGASAAELQPQETEAVITAESVLANAEKAYDAFSVGYLENYIENAGDYNGEWTDATFQAGVLDLYEATGNADYFRSVFRFANGRNWKLNGGVNTTYLDALAYAQVYCRLYQITKVADISDVIAQLDYNYEYGIYDYSWIDEIYMLGWVNPYLSALTGNAKYAELDFASYQKFRRQLLDFDEGLWYRDSRYVYSLQNPVGCTLDNEKVLWSRGNAWVYTSLVRRLSYMEKSDPAYATYLYDFKMMSAALVSRQREDGFWNVNLSGSQFATGKETTGTSGFLYGLSTGIRLGILDGAEYRNAAERAYVGLTTYALQENGLVGYCQPIGWEPTDYNETAFAENTNSFGVGLFLSGLTAFAAIV